MSIILCLGNYMNGGTRNGQADGFELDILRKLENTKNTTKKVSLLQYIAKMLVARNPTAPKIRDSLNNVFRAASLAPLDQLVNDVRSLKNRFNSMKKTC
mmetsp:Transcript_24636/g.34790  ORF Transcript_24636/g.34790 Transcript_24636/m.34790 type:complete len:99 (+) Transcript_24636:1-297(+)